jgi:hypothetical protein
MEIGAADAIAIATFLVGFCAGYFVRSLVSWRRRRRARIMGRRFR